MTRTFTRIKDEAPTHALQWLDMSGWDKQAVPQRK
jgi:hypothetical protein